MCEIVILFGGIDSVDIFNDYLLKNTGLQRRKRYNFVYFSKTLRNKQYVGNDRSFILKDRVEEKRRLFLFRIRGWYQ